MKNSALWLETPLYVAVMTMEDKLHVGPVVAVNVAWVCPCATVTLAGTCAFAVLLEESATTTPPAGEALVRVTVPMEEVPQFNCDGDITSDESAGGPLPLTVNCAPAEDLAQGALAVIVTKSCALIALVEIVTEALCAPFGTVTGPVQAGVPAHPGKVAIWVPEMAPSLTRIDTTELASLASTTRLRVTVAVSVLPPVTVFGDRTSDWIPSGGGVTVMLLLIGDPAPLLAVTVAARLEVALLVAVSVPRVLFEVHAASIEKLPSVVNALEGLVVTEILAPPNGAAPESVPCVNAFAPPAIEVIGAPFASVTLNEASDGTAIDPPGCSVKGVVSEIRLRFLPLDASVNEMSVQIGACEVDVTTLVG